MSVDWSLRFGDLVSFLGFALGGLTVIFMMKSDIRALALELGFLQDTVAKVHSDQNQKIDNQSKEIARFGELLNLMGRYEERMLVMRREIDEFDRWRQAQQEK